MGNEGSKLKGLVIDKNAVEASDFWSLFNAECPSTNEDGRSLSVFQGEPIVKGQLWVAQGPMERAIKNLMIYRHPYILKYVTTWEEGGHKHLATERVRPLADVLSAQSDIQVCLGLRTILCSLIFLVERALARHLNICTQSIYVTDNGSWRLAGFEYVWKSKDVNKQLLELSHSFRYQEAIDTAADRDKIDSIEQFAFATLCEHILAKCLKDESATPHVQEFRNYCSTHLKHKNPQMRPKLSAVLLHPYFNHEFVLIHSFLFELPLKSVQERQQFFTSLIGRLRYFDEDVVASQLSTSLLSRMVLLDATAQLCVTPYVLGLKTEHSAALFSHKTYVDYLLPKILKMFRLRDAQIRLILLEYFMEYVRLLSEEQLKNDILPHLLTGMHDTKDVLVAKTLRCMADLVPILGAAIVMEGPRTRIFADGRPHAAVTDTSSHWVEPRSITPVMNGNDIIDDYMVSGSPMPPIDRTDLNGSFNSLPQIDDNLESSLSLPLRLSPDGGEDNKSSIVLDQTPDGNNLNEITTPVTHNGSGTPADNDEEAWSDWETSDELQRLSTSPINDKNELSDMMEQANITANVNEIFLTNYETNSSSSHTTQATQNSTSEPYGTAVSGLSVTSNKSDKKNIDDLSSLDIQVQVNHVKKPETNEFDFFKDMEPVIIQTKLTHNQNIPVNEIKDAATDAVTPSSTSFSKHQSSLKDEEIKIDASRFAAAQAFNGFDDEENGWEDDDDDDDTVVWTNP